MWRPRFISVALAISVATKGAENVAREGKKGVDNVKREVSKGVKKLFR
jgi:hypothetical protein